MGEHRPVEKVGVGSMNPLNETSDFENVTQKNVDSEK